MPCGGPAHWPRIEMAPHVPGCAGFRKSQTLALVRIAGFPILNSFTRSFRLTSGPLLSAHQGTNAASMLLWGQVVSMKFTPCLIHKHPQVLYQADSTRRLSANYYCPSFPLDS